MHRKTYTILGAAVLVVAALVALQHAGTARAATNAVTTAGGIQLHDAATQTKQFMRWDDEIRLTPAQEKIRVEALSTIPAPCCSDNPMTTCCCPCNLAKSVWGLSKHLITEKGTGAAEVHQAALDWIAFINPGGFTGDACYTGGCGRPARANGCGGMNEASPVF